MIQRRFYVRLSTSTSEWASVLTAGERATGAQREQLHNSVQSRYTLCDSFCANFMMPFTEFVDQLKWKKVMGRCFDLLWDGRPL